MKTDPPVRPDGLCVVCLRPRKPEQARKYRAEAERDPFDRTECARKWHGAELVAHEVWGNGTSGLGVGLRRGRPSKAAA